MAAAQAFFRSAQAVTGMSPNRVTTDGHDSYPRAIRTTLGKGVRHRTSAYLNNRLEQDHRGIKGRYRPMRGFKCPRSALGSVGLTMNCAPSSASAPATTSMFPPTARDSSTSGGPRPCWPSWKPRDPGLASSQLRQYLLARALTEPLA